MEHANKYNILYPLQHGFRARRSCETQLIDRVNDIVNNMQAGLQTDVCVLDFAKAFVNVSHPHLMHKLHWYGINGEVHRWIQNFLGDRTQRVVVEGVLYPMLHQSINHLLLKMYGTENNMLMLRNTM